MKILLNWLIAALAIVITAYLLPGVHLDGFLSALIVAVVLGILNAIIKPLLIILTLPVNILTLGLFTLVINAVIILFASSLVSGFQVDGFWWALLFAVILSLVNSILNSFGNDK